MIATDFLVKLGGGLAILGAIWLHGCSVGQAGEKRKAEAAAHQAMSEARVIETNWQKHAQSLNEARNEELRMVADSHARALAGLRNRAPARMPAASEPACAGAGPAQLSRPDAEFLVGEAAAADQLRADYAACVGWIEAVKR